MSLLFQSFVHFLSAVAYLAKVATSLHSNQTVEPITTNHLKNETLVEALKNLPFAGKLTPSLPSRLNTSVLGKLSKLESPERRGSVEFFGFRSVENSVNQLIQFNF